MQTREPMISQPKSPVIDANAIEQKAFSTYQIINGLDRDSWDGYRLGSMRYSDKYKVHVSLDLNKENFAKARQMILDLMFKHTIHCFKLVNKEPKQGRYARNVYGKELTIYLQLENELSLGANEKDPDTWINLFNDLEKCLIAEGVKPNKLLTQGDQRFPGSKGYIFFRYPENIIGRYVSADALRVGGFTISEGVNLSNDKTFENFFAGKKLHHMDTLLAVDAPTPPDQKRQNYVVKDIDHLEKDEKTIFTQLESRLSGPASDDDNFFGEGDFLDRENVKGPHEKMARLFRHALGFGFSRNYEEEMKRHETTTIKDIEQEAQPLKKYFDDCLKLAAHHIAIIRHTLTSAGLTLPDLIGNITPAVYHYFFKPIMHVWKSNPTIAFDSLVQRDILIKEIIKCSFRDIFVNQLDFEKPKYILNLTEIDVEDLSSQTIAIADKKKMVAPVVDIPRLA